MSISYVRLKPHDPSKGNLKERFRMGAACGWQDLMFLAGQTQEIDTEAARWLEANIYQIEGQPQSGKAFDVWHSKEEYAKALRAEKLASLGRKPNRSAVVAANKPPVLKYAEVSDLDEPPATSAAEAELMADLELASRGLSGDIGAKVATPSFGAQLEEAKALAKGVAVQASKVAVGSFDSLAPPDDVLEIFDSGDDDSAASAAAPPDDKPKRRPGRPRKKG